MTTEEYRKKRPLAIFLGYFARHKGIFAADILCATAIAAIDLAFPMVTRQALYDMLPNKLYVTFFTVIAIMIACYILRSALNYIVCYYGHTFGIRVEADIREDLFTHIEQMSFDYFDANRTGTMMSRLTTDLFDLTELAHHGPEDLLTSVITVVGALTVMATIQWRLALLVGIMIPLLLGVMFALRRRMSRVSAEVKKKTGHINTEIESSLSGIRTAKAFANEDQESEKFEQANAMFRGSKVEYYKAMGLFMSGMEFTTSIAQAAVIAVGGVFIMRGTMSYIDLLTFTLYVSTFVTPVKKLAQFAEVYMQGTAGFSRFLEIMRTEPTIKDAPDAKELGNVRGDIEYKNVSFDYGSGVPVLDNINLHIRPGESFAVVGPSGGGKTTLCQLLPRFYDVCSGSITIDGTDIRSVTQASLRRNIGLIQQDVFMFAGTIRENIRYGRPDATDEEIVQAAIRAEIHSEIMDMPDGYDTYIGERGVMLSGGQKQRISIARVFLKNPQILILDEATSALDTVTERRIQDSLDKLAQGRTTIIIAHRLSTVSNADVIAVVEGEHIIEMGPPKELMEKNGEYARLCRAQEIDKNAQS